MSFLRWRPYPDQVKSWPGQERVILAHFDEQSIVCYQAYNPQIAAWIAANQRLGGPGYSLERMTWIKPGFLWMMHRSGWASKRQQERVLALRLRRPAFDALLAQAEYTAFAPEVYADEAAWAQAQKRADVLLQWDPDHDPRGIKLKRRAIQIGLRGGALNSLSEECLMEVEDITPQVHEQARTLRELGKDFLFIPIEKIYPVRDQTLARKLMLDKTH